MSAFSRARAWWTAARPLAQGNIAPALVFGQAVAYSVTGRFDPVACGLVQLFGIADHLFIVFANDVADSESDALNRTFNVFSGGSRALSKGLVTKRALARAAVGMGVAAVGIASALARRTGQSALAGLGVVAIALMVAYSFRPLRLSYRGGGEVLQGLGIGVVLPLVGFLAQCPDVGRIPLVALVPTFVLGVAGNITTALPDVPSDRASGKLTWPVRRGEETARRDAMTLIGLGVACVPFVTPGLSFASLAIMVPPLALLMANARIFEGPGANAEHRDACLAFVARNGFAIGYVVVAWSVALFSGRS